MLLLHHIWNGEFLNSIASTLKPKNRGNVTLLNAVKLNIVGMLKECMPSV